MSDKIQILTVDDEPHVGHLIKHSLDVERYEVTVVHSALEAMKQAEKKKFHVFLIDLLMPGINGYELINWLKTKNTLNKKSRVIVISAKTQFHDKLHAIDVGADNYITKPFDPKELERHIFLEVG